MYISYDKYVCHVIQVNLHSSTGLLIFTKRPMKIEQECLLSNDSLASAFFQCTHAHIYNKIDTWNVFVAKTITF